MKAWKLTGRDATPRRPLVGPALDHRISYTWNEHSQLASVKSLAGEFTYGYDAKSPALLTKMTGPAHIAETSYDANRTITVTGHTDNIPLAGGQYVDNFGLAAARAASVVRELVATGQIDAARISAVSKGEFEPVADNTTEVGREANRRVVLRVDPLRR